ncbi:MAG: polysaccharide deacetylase family protein [Alphaproteobacteria bacterium]
MPEAYLTIDDGPSETFTALVDFLHKRKIPAVFFNRGDNMDARPEAVLYGIERGFIMANHTYSHRRASQLTLTEMQGEIARTDEILERLYQRAGVKRPGKYFRFPYMDRGMGPCFTEPEGLKEEHATAHRELLQGGLGHIPKIPDENQIAHKRKIQEILKSLGYTPLPTPGVKIPWYAETEMAQSIDSLCTFSTSDWALQDRHRGKHGFSTLKDLTDKIDTDPWLKSTSRHIILAHDQSEIHDTVIGLTDHFIKTKFKFLPFDSSCT